VGEASVRGQAGVGVAGVDDGTREGELGEPDTQ